MAKVLMSVELHSNLRNTQRSSLPCLVSNMYNHLTKDFNDVKRGLKTVWEKDLESNFAVYEWDTLWSGTC